jgi:mycoredoxin
VIHSWHSSQITIVCMRVVVYSAEWCRDCRAAKQFLETHGVTYTEVDVELDPTAFDDVFHNVGKRAIPQMVINGEWWQPYAPGRGLLYDEMYTRLGIPRG